MAAACVLVGGLVALGVQARAGAAPVTLYAGVSPSGSGNCVSVANACTLTTALADTAAGDVVALVTPGVEGTTSTYYSGGFSIGTAGTSASSPVVIEPAPGVANPILDSAGANVVLTVTNNMHLVIDAVTIQNGKGGSGGGGITNSSGGTLTVADSTFTGDQTRYDGGAIDNGDGGSGTLTVTDSTFTGNSAAIDGGAIANVDNGGSGTLTVTDSTFSGNQSGGNGGAIDNADDTGSGTLTVTDSTFSGNQSGGNGGAIDNADDTGSGTLTVTDSTFTGNKYGDGETIDSGIDYGTGNATVAADIFAGSCYQGKGTWTDDGYNVGSDTSCQNGGTGDATSATLASLLGPLANNGGPTQTMLLLSGNPASGLIPNGSGGLCPIAADQTGVPAPRVHLATRERSNPIR